MVRLDNLRLCPCRTRPLLGLIRTAPEQRDMRRLEQIADQLALLWQMLEGQLARNIYVAGQGFTIADICVGAYARRWFGYEDFTRPSLRHTLQSGSIV